MITDLELARLPRLIGWCKRIYKATCTSVIMMDNSLVWIDGEELHKVTQNGRSKRLVVRFDVSWTWSAKKRLCDVDVDGKSAKARWSRAIYFM